MRENICNGALLKVMDILDFELQAKDRAAIKAVLLQVYERGFDIGAEAIHAIDHNISLDRQPE